MLVHRDRRQFVRQGGGDGRLAVGHDRQAFAVGAVHRVEHLIGIPAHARPDQPLAPQRTVAPVLTVAAREGRGQTVFRRPIDASQKIGRRRFLDRMVLSFFPEHAEAIAAYDLRWHETVLGAIDGSVAILEELHARGTPLYAITNFNQDKFRETQGRFAFLSRFRDIVVSGDERLIKPDPAIYRLCLVTDRDVGRGRASGPHRAADTAA